MPARRQQHARAPVRIDCAGGGTDCPPYATDVGGVVVNVGIALHALASIEPTEAGVEIVSDDFGRTLRADTATELPLGGGLDLLAAVVRRLAPAPGMRLRVRSDVPPGSGLGSSGAVGVACVAALDASQDIDRGPAETARLANEIERIDLGHAGGDQDSYGPAFGGWNVLTYEPGQPTHVEQVDPPPAFVREFERRAVLVHVGEPHLSGSIHEDIKRSYAQPGSPTRRAMEGLHQCGIDCAAAVRAGDLRGFAECLSRNWGHHQGLHPSCISPDLQAAYTAAEGLVLGGKTCGAGGGGCILFLARDDGRAELVRRLCGLGGQILTTRVDPEGVVTWRA